MSDEKQKIQELAETLKSQGIAASMADAVDKARNIIVGIKPKPKVEIKPVENITQVSKEDNSQKVSDVINETSSINNKNDDEQFKLNDIGDDRTLGEATKDLESDRTDELSTKELVEETASKDIKDLEQKDDELNLGIEEDQKVINSETSFQNELDDEELKVDASLNMAEEVMRPSETVQEDGVNDQSSGVSDSKDINSDISLSDIHIESSESKTVDEPVKVDERSEHDSFSSSEQSDDLDYKNTEKVSDFIGTIDESDESDNQPLTQSLIDEGNEESNKPVPSEVQEKKKTELSDKEKEDADLSKIFNFSKK